jgi:hypothetical protein
MMKKLIIFAIIAIVLLNTILVANVLIKSYKAEQREELLYRIEKDTKLYYANEHIMALRNASDQYEELQYRLICQTIEENYDYYESFSKKCISEFEEYRDDEFYIMNGSFDLYTIINNKLENEFDRDLVTYDCRIMNEDGIIFVILGYPVDIKVLYFSDGYTTLKSYDCSVIYIPDEYMNEESIATLKNSGILPFEHVKGNLFVMKYPVMNY